VDLQCPRCHGPLDTSGVSAACHACRGLWVARTSLAEMIAEMRPDQEATLAFAPRVATEAALPCPRCERPMEPVTLEGVPVDTCTDDGVWFDADELSEALRRSHTVPSAPAPRDRSWLGRLLDRI
jgi:Zn-finger nucleic acid-binding protein